MGFDPAFIASGSGHRGGSVPDPGSVAGSTKFLREDSSFAYPYAFSTELGGGASVMDFAGIAATARHLRFLLRVQSDVSGGSPVALSIILENDTSSLYSTRSLILAPASTPPLFVQTNAVGSILLCDTTSDSPTNRPIGLDTSGSTTLFCEGIVDLPYYSSSSATADQHLLANLAGLVDTAGSWCALDVRGRYRHSAVGAGAVSRVIFQVASGNFSSASRIQMIGLS